jgi:histidyl-tRNA synthetase
LQNLKGFRDFFPEDMAERNHVFDAWRRVAKRFGFVEYDGPPLELLELYTRKSGEEIVEQLYTFTDKGDREVALRPEMTPTLARMMAARVTTLPKPIKWFSIPQLFRYERNQRGRLREHFQLNVDIIGASEVEADAELLAVALSVQLELGLQPDDVVARVNDRRIVAGALGILSVPDERIAAVYAALDKFRKIASPEKFAELLNDAGVPPDSVPELMRLCDGSVSVFEWFAPRLEGVDATARRAVADLENYLGLMNEKGLGELVEVDFSIVRGLAYYTGIVFELYDRKGKERAICGGGRYDDLIASLGGPEMPALGFGMGDVVLSLILRDRGLMPATPPRADVVVIPVGAELASAARRVTDDLRRAEVRAETPYSPSGVGKDMKAATQHKIPYAVIVGPDEWGAREVNLKNLTTGEQSRVPLSELAERIRSSVR